MRLPARCSTIFLRNRQLKHLTEHARYLSGLDLRVNELFGSPLCQHVEIAAVRDDTLVVQTNSPAWAARVRYLVPELLQRLASLPDFPRIRSIRVRVAITPPSTPSPPPRPQISAATAALLRAQAAVTTDVELRNALLRLAQGRRAK